jgi:sulfite exporter TauE/SafE
MFTALAITALLMGLVGGPHCTVMCAAACAGIVRSEPAPRHAPWLFHAGRIAGYSAAGAVVAELAQGLSWLAGQTAALRPVWTLFHLAVLTWGLMLVVLARQPAWANDAGRATWSRVRPLVATRTGLVTAGALWVSMPCGLLYSALLVASLAGGALEGATAMALFAAGSGLWLAAAPHLVVRLRNSVNGWRQDWGTRLTGAVLVAAALLALGTDVAHRVAEWCGLG